MIVRSMVGDLAVVKVIAIDGGERERKKSARLDDSVSRRVEHLAVAGKTIKDGRGWEGGGNGGIGVSLSTAAYKISEDKCRFQGGVSFGLSVLCLSDSRRPCETPRLRGFNDEQYYTMFFRYV